MREQRVRHHRDHYRTTIVPVISWPWTAQSYWYVPGALNVTAYVPLPVMVLLLAKLCEPTDWTLCGRDPVQVQVRPRDHRIPIPAWLRGVMLLAVTIRAAL